MYGMIQFVHPTSQDAKLKRKSHGRDQSGTLSWAQSSRRLDTVNIKRLQSGRVVDIVGGQIGNDIVVLAPGRRGQ